MLNGLYLYFKALNTSVANIKKTATRAIILISFAVSP